MEQSSHSDNLSQSIGIFFPAARQVKPFRSLPPMPEHWTSLASVFVHQARETPDKVLVSDETGETITYGVF